MSSIHLHFRGHARDDGQWGRLFLRVIHRRQPVNITLPFRISSTEWDSVSHSINHADATAGRSQYLRQVEKGVTDARVRLTGIMDNLSLKGEFTATDVATVYRYADQGLTSVVRGLQEELRAAGQYRTARAYQTALNGILGFTGKKELRGEELTPALIRRFEQFMKEKNLALNTISFHMRNLRAVYNKACERGIFVRKGGCPFQDVYTGVATTPNRALKKTDLIHIENLLEEPGKLPPSVLDVLHIFLFTFHAQGMCFVDLAYLKKASVKGNELVYRRKKTGQLIRVPLTRQLKRHIGYFRERVKDSEYLFPIIRGTGPTAYRQYCNGLTLTNRRLKELQKYLGLSRPLSMHQSRHSWATIARGERISDEVISAGLGHSSLQTTRIYLDSFELPILREAALKVSRSIRPV